MARILVVEDNPLNMKLVTVILQRAGHEVISAGDAEDAERKIDRQVPDLILMDLGLPGKDGYAFTRELRLRPSTSRKPIVAVTAYAMKGDWEKARDAGCNDYITKPIDGAYLSERVKYWLAVSPDGETTEAADAIESRRVPSRASGG
ncbi:MAG: response regulator [Thermoplasmata archaeon]